MATPIPSESNSSSPVQTVIVMPIAESSTNHRINQTHSNPEAMPYVVQHNPETSINHGIPGNSEPKPVIVIPTSTNIAEPSTNHQINESHRNPEAMPYIVQQNPETSTVNRTTPVPNYSEPKPILVIPPNTTIPDCPAIPPGFDRTNQPTPSPPLQTHSLNISNTSRDPQVVYIHADSWPQANQPHLQNREEPPRDKEHPETKPGEVISCPTVPDMLADSVSARGRGSLKHRAGGHVANTAGNLANLLPTGTVLAFQALIPTLSNSGKCQSTNKYLVGCTVAFCAMACFFSSFTDSYMDRDGGKLYYGVVTRKGLWVLNGDGEEEGIKELREEKYKVKKKDYVHAVGSVLVFMVFAVSSVEVVECFFAGAKEMEYSNVFLYLPLVAGILASCFFTVCPTTRRGIGYAGL